MNTKHRILFRPGEHIFFVGIKGVAMTALALYAKECGCQVSGSDVVDTFPTDEILKKASIFASRGFDPANITHGTDVVIYTGAHGGYTNPQVAEARRKKIRVLSHGQALGLAMEGFRQISVAGSHGKTTTSAMIATILAREGLNPSWAIGCGQIRPLGNPGHRGEGLFFVAEADEYVTDPQHDQTPRFLWQHPNVLVVTNVDFDHPDVYRSIDDVTQVFVTLVEAMPQSGVLIHTNDPESLRLRKSAPQSVSVGEKKENSYVISRVHLDVGKTTFSLSDHKETVELSLRIPGAHNVLNAALAAAASRAVGVPWKAITSGLSTFVGTQRRFEYRGLWNGIPLYDDYAHHPREIKATLSGAKAWFGNKRIIAVFQPHTFSRTKALLAEFSVAFVDSDVVCISDIYASARERDTMGITGEILAASIKKYHKKVFFTPTLSDIRHTLQDVALPNDVILCMGAGDIWMWQEDLFSEKEIRDDS